MSRKSPLFILHFTPHPLTLQEPDAVLALDHDTHASPQFTTHDTRPPAGDGHSQHHARFLLCRIAHSQRCGGTDSRTRAQYVRGRRRSHRYRCLLHTSRRRRGECRRRNAAFGGCPRGRATRSAGGLPIGRHLSCRSGAILRERLRGEPHQRHLGRHTRPRHVSHRGATGRALHLDAPARHAAHHAGQSPLR